MPPPWGCGLEASPKYLLSLRPEEVGAAHRGEIGHVQVVAAEHDAGDGLGRHRHAAVHGAVRRVAHELARDDLRVPEIALLVDGGAVGDTGLVVGVGEDPLVGDRAGLDVVIVGVDLLHVGIGVIEGLVVGAPARPVVADDATLQLMHGEIGVEPEEAADGRFRDLVLAAGEEAAAAVHLAVVEERARLVRVHQGDELGLAAVEVHEVEAVPHGEHAAALLAQRERAHGLGHGPGAGPA